MPRNPAVMKMWLDMVLREHARVAIVGGPRAGKSTIVGHITDREVIHTDSYNGEEWDALPGLLIDATQGKERFVIEGVHAARALRKGMQVDAIVFIDEPVVERNPGQAAMAKGIRTIFNDYLENRGADNTPVLSMGEDWTK